MREEAVITEDERRCLRMWFRQAIAQLEQEEVSAAIFADKYEEPGKHRTHSARRRTRRTRMIPHLRELVF